MEKLAPVTPGELLREEFLVPMGIFARRGHDEDKQGGDENSAKKIMKQALLDQALAMPPHERIELAEILLASIEQEEEIRKKWIVEVKDRMAAVKTGKAKLIEFDSLYHED